MSMKQMVSAQNLLNFSTKVLLFLLPWQTMWILQEYTINGVKWQYGTIGLYATEIVLWCVVILFLVAYVRQVHRHRHEERFHFSKDRVLAALCFVFVLYSFASVFWAPVPEVARQHALYLMEACVLFFVLLLGPLSTREIATWLVAGSVLPSVLGLWQFLAQSTIASAFFGLALHPVTEPGTSVVVGEGVGRWLRAYGSFSHPNVFGGYLTLVLFAVIVACTSLRRSQTRVFLLAGGVLATSALFFTFSRSAWIATGLLWVAVLTQKGSVQRAGRVKIMACFAALCIVLSVAYAPLVETRLLRGNSAHESASMSERVSGFQEAKNIFGAAPVRGHGMGNYTAAALARSPEAPGWTLQPVHTVPILIATELGIVGLVLAAGVLVQLCMLAPRKKWVACTGVLPLLPLIFFDHYMWSSHVGLLLAAIWVALVFRPLVIHGSSTQSGEEGIF